MVPYLKEHAASRRRAYKSLKIKVLWKPRKTKSKRLAG
jgi:hypothetical protein